MEAGARGRGCACGDRCLEETLIRRQVWAIVLLLAGFLAVTADVLLSGPLTRLDWVVHVFVDSQVRGVWWVVSDVAAYVGGNQYLLVGSLGVLCLAVAARYRSLRPLVVVFVVCVVLATVIPGLKEITGRTPPKEGVDLVFTDETEYPSGHALNGIVFWGLLLELARSASRRVQRLVSPRLRNAVLVVTAATGGLGMVGMDYHWLSDVFAGWLLGAAMFVALLGRDPLRPIREKRDNGAAPRVGAATGGDGSAATSRHAREDTPSPHTGAGDGSGPTVHRG